MAQGRITSLKLNNGIIQWPEDTHVGAQTLTAPAPEPPMMLAGFEVRKGITGWIVVLDHPIGTVHRFHAFTTWEDMIAWMVGAMTKGELEKHALEGTMTGPNSESWKG